MTTQGQYHEQTTVKEGIGNSMLGCDHMGLFQGQLGMVKGSGEKALSQRPKFPYMTLGTSLPFSQPILSLVK